MSQYEELIKALRYCVNARNCEKCAYRINNNSVKCRIQRVEDAADAIEALQAEVGQWKAALKGQEDGIKVLQAEVERQSLEIDKRIATEIELSNQVDALHVEIRGINAKCAECGAEPITLEQAIDRLHELGWLQEHDRILSQPHWVSVEDELPKNVANRVLVFCKNGVMYAAHYEGGETDKWYMHMGTWWEEGTGNLTVTHWMPLPNPPMEE